jgi:hypothetical protein
VCVYMESRLNLRRYLRFHTSLVGVQTSGDIRCDYGKAIHERFLFGILAVKSWVERMKWLCLDSLRLLYRIVCGSFIKPLIG